MVTDDILRALVVAGSTAIVAMGIAVLLVTEGIRRSRPERGCAPDDGCWGKERGPGRDVD
jgi:hypothetical protein